MERNIRRVLITGVCGAAGRSMVRWLRANHPEVEMHGLARRVHSRTPVDGCALHEGDILDALCLFRLLEDHRPDAIFHFAANPDKCFETPVVPFQNNLIGTVNLLEAMFNCGATGALINVSSSEVYGQVDPKDIPIREDCPTRPVSPYAVAKLAQDHLGRVYHQAYGLPVVTTRAFTYVNLLRRDLFTSDFARQIAEVEQGKRTVLKHGNLDSVRVMLDTDSICEAYWLAAVKGVAGEAYNLGGEVRVTVGEVLECLIRLSGRYIPCEQDPALLRPVDVTLQVPDSTKFRDLTGWCPRFDLEVSMRKLLEHWRREVLKA